jgi:hypothetical protein
MQSAGRKFLRLCGVAIIAAGLAAALALIFVQLRLVPVSDTVIGYCGPGFTSANALQVKLDPGIVNTGGTGQPPPLAEQRRLEQLCTRQADGRLAGAGILAGVALLLGLPLIALGSRQSTRSASPGSAEPSSLSSSGTSGSTVWK